MGIRSVPAAGQAIEHITEVADQCVFDRRGIDPLAVRLDLQSALFILCQQSE